MGEENSISFKGLRQDIPEGESEESGYCFRDALDKAGYNTDLPAWVHVDDVPVVCNELGLAYQSGQGRDVSLNRNEPVIIGHIVKRPGEGKKRIGHWSFLQSAGQLVGKILPKDIFAIIKLPR